MKIIYKLITICLMLVNNNLIAMDLGPLLHSLRIFTMNEENCVCPSDSPNVEVGKFLIQDLENIVIGYLQEPLYSKLKTWDVCNPSYKHNFKLVTLPNKMVAMSKPFDIREESYRPRKEQNQIKLLDNSWFNTKLGPYDDCSSSCTDLIILSNNRIASAEYVRESEYDYTYFNKIRIYCIPQAWHNFQQIHVNTVHNSGIESIYSLAELPGNLLAGATLQTIFIWDLATGLIRHQYPIADINSLASANNNLLICGSSKDGKLIIIDTHTHQQLFSIQAHNPGGKIHIVSLPNNQLASASSNEKGLKIWDLNTGQLVSELHGHKENITGLALLSDNQLVSGSYDNTVKIWDIPSKRWFQEIEFDKPIRTISTFDSQIAIALFDDHQVHVFDTAENVRKYEAEEARMREEASCTIL